MAFAATAYSANSNSWCCVPADIHFPQSELCMEEETMADTKRTTAVGVFHNRAEAQQAIAELRRAGFRDDQIGMAARDDDGGTSGDGDDEESSYAGEGALTGAAAGAG